MRQARHRGHCVVWLHFPEAPGAVKFTETDGRMVAARDWLEPGMENHCLMGTEFQSVKMEKLWRQKEDMVVHAECT